MPVVYVAHDLWEAQLVVHQLEQHGLVARIENTFAAAAFGELPYMASRPRVVVERDADGGKARTAIVEFEARRGVPVEGLRKCKSCGEENPSNFELCWSCRSDLDQG